MTNNQTILDKANYPRPDFIRKNWISLNGEWEFAFPSSVTKKFPYEYMNTHLPQNIQVPFSYTSAASGIDCPDEYDEVYYARSFSVQEHQLQGEVLLMFGAVDYSCDVWVNHFHVGSHFGGHTQFQFAISQFLHPGENRIFLLAKDDKSCDRPRGKQYWKEKPDRCWYTNTIGIWKHVWLEFTSAHYIEHVKLTPDIDRRCVELEVFLNQPYSGTLSAAMSFDESHSKISTYSFRDTHYLKETLSVTEEDFIDEIHYWTYDHPNLYNLTLTLQDCDQVDCYFGMRKIEARNGQILLNNRPVYQRLILDQGYWEESLMTPPSRNALKTDIELTKKLGFNGARKHQKLEDSHYYYWADVLGLLVWCEMPSGYLFNDLEIHSFLSEWQEIIQETYNHPCIITWVPLNESWGVRNILTDSRQQDFASSVYFLTKAYDPSRLISTNDGWENPAHTDLFCIHDYEASSDTLSERYRDLKSFSKTGMPNRQALAHNADYQGQPFLITEYGGIARAQETSEENWGYNLAALSDEDYIARIKTLTGSILRLPNCCGYCYTQLTDVLQEVNGLLYSDHTPKVPLESLSEIFSASPV